MAIEGREAQAAAGGRLAKKRAIVTGAASGMGRASAVRFVREGAAVLLVDRDEQGLQDALAEALEGGGSALAQVADVSSEADVEGFVQRAVRELGGLEIMFANAGISDGPTPFLEQTAERWEAVLRVNLIGVFLCVQRAARHMTLHGGGSILCTASVAALRARAGRSAYSSSKAGVVSLVQTAANELAGSNVRVNAICPGLIETGMTRAWFDAAREAGVGHRMGSLTPAGRAGTSEDIAHVALFLASDDSSYVNGQAIAVDGGLSSSHPFSRRVL